MPTKKIVEEAPEEEAVSTVSNLVGEPQDEKEAGDPAASQDAAPDSPADQKVGAEEPEATQPSGKFDRYSSYQEPRVEQTYEVSGYLDVQKPRKFVLLGVLGM